MSRRWIKLYPEETFTGSTFIELTYKERYVWWGLLLMAGRSANDGVVFKRWNTGYTHQQLAYELDCPVSIIKSALSKMIIKRQDEEMPKIKILDNGIIEICNWNKYQSEYDRTKKYYYNKSTTNSVDNGVDIYPIDIEVDIEEEKEKEIFKEKGCKQLVNNLPISTGKQKYNYAIGMKIENSWNEEKETRDNNEPSPGFIEFKELANKLKG